MTIQPAVLLVVEVLLHDMASSLSMQSTTDNRVLLMLRTAYQIQRIATLIVAQVRSAVDRKILMFENCTSKFLVENFHTRRKKKTKNNTKNVHTNGACIILEHLININFILFSFCKSIGVRNFLNIKNFKIYSIPWITMNDQ